MMKLLRYILLLCLLCAGPLRMSIPMAVAQPATKPTAKTALEEKSLLVFPNPSTGIVHISISGAEGRKMELRILNVIGTVIYRESLTELNDRFTKTLDLSKFASGLYYVKLESDESSTMRKLVIR